MPAITTNDLKNGITLELENGLFTVVEFQLRGDGVEMRAEVGLRHRALVGKRVAPLLPLHMDARVREHALEARVAHAREPRCVVEVQMREDDVRDVARIDAELGERIDGSAALERVHRALAVGPLVAAARLDEDESVA